MAFRFSLPLFCLLNKRPHCILGNTKACACVDFKQLSTGIGILDGLECDSIDASLRPPTNDQDASVEEVQWSNAGKIALKESIQSSSYMVNTHQMGLPSPPGIYKAFLVGEVGSQPIQRSLGAGKYLTLFSLATGGMRVYRKPYGNETALEYANCSAVQWHRVSIYEGRAALLAIRNLKQGSRVYVEGNIETRIYTESKTGVLKRIREIAVRRNGRLLIIGQQLIESSEFTEF